MTSPCVRRPNSRKTVRKPQKQFIIVFSSDDDDDDNQIDLPEEPNSSSKLLKQDSSSINQSSESNSELVNVMLKSEYQNSNISTPPSLANSSNSSDEQIISLETAEGKGNEEAEEPEKIIDYLDEFGVSIIEYEKELYDEMLKANCLYEISRPRDIDLSFQLTQMSMPTSNEIEYAPTLCNSFADRDFDCSRELFYIKEISEAAFDRFQFGRQFNEPHVDRLHLFAWHNISKPPELMAQLLLNQVNNLRLEDQFTYQYYRCVISYVLEWIHWFSLDFFTNDKCCKVVYNIIDKLFESYKDLRKDCILLKCLVKILHTRTKTPGQFQFQPATPTFVTLDNITHERIFSLQVDPKIIVRHFKYNGINDWHKIAIQELISVNWTDKKHKGSNSPHVVSLTNHANNRVLFIVQTILNYPSKHKTSAISYWIRVMQECRNERNYQLLLLIDGALNNPAIQNLSKGWKKVDKDLIKSFVEMRQLTIPTRNSTQKYRLEMLKNPRNALPFIGPFLTEIVTIDEGNKTFITKENNEKWINIFKQRAYFAEIEMIFKEWGGEIDCEIDPYVLQLLAEIDAGLVGGPDSK